MSACKIKWSIPERQTYGYARINSCKLVVKKWWMLISIQHLKILSSSGVLHSV